MLAKDRAGSVSESETRNDLTQPEDAPDNETEPSAEVEAFMNALLVPSYECPGEESFFDELSTVISRGLKLAVPVMDTAISGLCALNSVIPTEAAMLEKDTDQHMHLLCKRAVMGEAALQSLFGIEPNQLPEGFLDTFKRVVQRMGRQVRTLAPTVTKTATPILKELLKGELPDPTSGNVAANIAATRKFASTFYTEADKVQNLLSHKDKNHPELRKPLHEVLLVK